MSLTVLLVEDDRELRAMLREALSVEGYRVLASASLADARAVIVHAVAERGIDLVLLRRASPGRAGPGRSRAPPRRAR